MSVRTNLTHLCVRTNLPHLCVRTHLTHLSVRTNLTYLSVRTNLTLTLEIVILVVLELLHANRQTDRLVVKPIGAFLQFIIMSVPKRCNQNRWNVKCLSVCLSVCI